MKAQTQSEKFVLMSTKNKVKILKDECITLTRQLLFYKWDSESLLLAKENLKEKLCLLGKLEGNLEQEKLRQMEARKWS